MSSEKTAPAVILLVDDNKMGLTARCHVLRELGYRTISSSSARSALEVFTKQHVDLVVTDYKMPDMSGIDLIREMRAVKAQVPVILMSGFVDVLGLDEQTTGADLVVPKSANEVNHLVRSVSRLLNRKPAKKPPASERPQPKSRRKSV